MAQTDARKEYMRQYNREYRTRPLVKERLERLEASPARKARKRANARARYARMTPEQRAAQLKYQRQWAVEHAAHIRTRANARYARNPARVRARQAAWARRRREEYRTIVTLAKQDGCSQCGYNQSSAALHFHHKDPAEKKFSIGNVVASYVRCAATSEKALRAEMAKCAVLCANCHHALHEKERYAEFPED